MAASTTTWKEDPEIFTWLQQLAIDNDENDPDQQVQQFAQKQLAKLNWL